MRRWIVMGLIVGSLIGGSGHSAAQPQTGITATVDVPINGMTVVAQVTITSAIMTDLDLLAEVPPAMDSGALVLTRATGQSQTLQVLLVTDDAGYHAFQSQGMQVFPGDTLSWQLLMDRPAMSGERVTITASSNFGRIEASATVLLNQITTTWLPVVVGAER
ncbi:hypothetical protein [Herpetosiphon geysericola]|uniref:DUF11 domain-containing protein n=1 Tax=Herpetosiphon geysericola TaxID=70996 RepID=A0A0N8GQ87_9CHLR|nr:hypothetical protein [Herpetosiphon geysericola]KPL83010.1 hypothetical protein SE18_19390 [Herpetosiphon geysericola]